MNIICFDDRFLIPVNKIVEVWIDDENKNKLVLWLDGGFVQRITQPSEEDAIDTFKFIKEQIKKL
jgi:hypothetical protein